MHGLRRQLSRVKATYVSLARKDNKKKLGNHPQRLTKYEWCSDSEKYREGKTELRHLLFDRTKLSTEDWGQPIVYEAGRRAIDDRWWQTNEAQLTVIDYWWSFSSGIQIQFGHPFAFCVGGALIGSLFPPNVPWAVGLGGGAVHHHWLGSREEWCTVNIINHPSCA